MIRRQKSFAVSPNTFNIAPGQVQTEAVNFAPDSTKDSALAVVDSNDPRRPTINVVLKGTGAPGKLSVSKTVTIKGTVGQTTQINLTLRNSGKGLLSGER